MEHTLTRRQTVSWRSSTRPGQPIGLDDPVVTIAYIGRRGQRTTDARNEEREEPQWLGS